MAALTYDQIKTIHIRSVSLTQVKYLKIRDVIQLFQKSTNFLIQKAVGNPIFEKISKKGKKYWNYSYPLLRKSFYYEWKHQFQPLHTHYCHSSAHIASEILTSWNTWRYKTRHIVDCPQYTKNTMRLERVLCQFDGKNLILVSEPRTKLFIPLQLHSFARRIIHEFGVDQYGEITISLTDNSTRLHIFIPFKKPISISTPSSYVPIDINERSIAYAQIIPKRSIALHSVDTSEIATCHYRYSLKRRRIASQIAQSHPSQQLQRRRLLAKYGQKERHKTNDYVHKLTHQLVEELHEENCTLILEKLRNIRQFAARLKNLKPWQIPYKKSKKLRRRLNRWNFGQFQRFLQYKMQAMGNAVAFINPRNTSCRCLNCGKITRCKSELFHCKSCGFTINRHLLALINIFGVFWQDLQNKSQDVASPVPAEGIQMKMSDGEFRELKETVIRGLSQVAKNTEMVLLLPT